MISLPHKKNGTPIYIQIYQELKNAITQHAIPANTKLLSKRKMAAQLGVSVNTVNTAYSQLVSEGFITVKPQSGYYVCQLDPLYEKNNNPLPALPWVAETEEKKTEIDFAIEGVDKTAFPYGVWRRLMKNAFNEYNPNLLDCSNPQGEAALRQAIAPYLYLSRGVRCHYGQIIIGAGTENLLQILSFLIDGHCTIAMENPVYHKAYQFFKLTGHQVTPIATDSHGVMVSPLESLKSAALYVTPSHQFPLGVTMPINRRIQLLNWAAAEEDRYIIEDDYDSEFRYGSRPIPALKSIDQRERVIYLGSFARSIAPALRISYMVLPETLLKKYMQCCTWLSCAVSKLDQLTLAQFIAHGHYETHLNKMRKLYKEKRECFVYELKKTFSEGVSIQGENAGHHLLIRVYNDMAESELCLRAQKKGVGVYPISPYFTGNLPSMYKSAILAGYATLSKAQIQEGVKRLYGVWKP